MRLTQTQQAAIRNTVVRMMGADARVWLFGSRVDDAARGGDIDLYIEADHIVPNRVQALCRLEGALVMALGDRKLDILLKDTSTPETPIFRIAKQNGVQL